MIFHPYDKDKDEFAIFFSDQEIEALKKHKKIILDKYHAKKFINELSRVIFTLMKDLGEKAPEVRNTQNSPDDLEIIPKNET
tara:strand:+ start:873 stop:1118 length:246 start_codon:yes stop_codon:yes gene_type:complete